MLEKTEMSLAYMGSQLDSNSMGTCASQIHVLLVQCDNFVK